MSTQSATQAATAPATATAEVQETSAVAQPVQTETAAPAAKRQKMTDRIVATLRAQEDGQTMTISELWTKMSDVKRETLQATLSQLVNAKRVEKVPTGKRQPGYKATK